MSNNAHDLSKRLLGALDEHYNVIDMRAVNEIISILENITITKELLETTRLGKHVNELRRKAKDPTLARRAKVLVKKWRDLVIPSSQHSTPTHTNTQSRLLSDSNRLSKSGLTPLTSPALSRVASVSPALSSSPHRNLTTKVWNLDNEDSDSNDVILVVDDPPDVVMRMAPLQPVVPLLPKPIDTNRLVANDEVVLSKKSKRDKKLKKKRGHGRAGSDSESTWADRNGGKNGTRNHPLPGGWVIPPPGTKKVKTTQELLEDIQSRLHESASAQVITRTSSPDDCEVIQVESPSEPAKPEPSPLCSLAEDSRDLDSRGRTPSPPPSPEPYHPPCECGDEPTDQCPANIVRPELEDFHLKALHHTLIPHVNGNTGKIIVPDLRLREVGDQDKPDLFASVVPLYRYLDYSKDRTVKNLSAVNLESKTRLNYTMAASAPVVRWPDSEMSVQDSLDEASATTERDNLGRPIETDNFAEWHEPVRLKSGLHALPYVVID